MNKSISLKKSLALFLDDWMYPVITDYQLALFFFHLHQKKKYKGIPVQLNSEIPIEQDLNLLIEQCLEDGILNINQDFPSLKVFNILGKHPSPSEDIICTVDPFAYVSHLSAMDYHGLTDRNPKILFISGPSGVLWKEFAEKRMQKDLKEYLFDFKQSKLPVLKKIPFEKINRRSIHYYSSSHLGAFRHVKNRPLRVSTIGRTFLDMLHEPDLCGGLEHVLDVYMEYAETYLDLIVKEIDRKGRPIDKVRAGYILDELNSLKHPIIKSWEKYIKQGGSRKLNRSEDYAPVYSKKWCLSINTIREHVQ